MLTQGFRKFYGSITEAAEAPKTIFQKRGGACRPVASSLSNPTSKMFWKGLDLNCYLHPYLDKFTPFTFFGNSFSVTLRNFTNFVTILIFLPQGYESLRIMYLLFFSFRRSYENSRIAKNTSFRFPSHYGIFTDRVSLLPFDFRHVSGLHILCNKGCQVSRSGQSKVAYHQIIIPGRN